MSEEHDPFARQIKTVLDQAANDLDADTAARLTRARRAAIDPLFSEPPSPASGESVARGAKPPGRGLPGRTPAPRHWYPAAGGLAIAASLLLAVGLWLSQPAPDTAPPDLEDLQLLAENPDLDFYQEMDFYVWLAEQNDEG